MTTTRVYRCGGSYARYDLRGTLHLVSAYMELPMQALRSIPLEFDEERIAQLLTRDAWSYFSSPTELADRLPVRSIPPMPRNGQWQLPEDPLIITYYLTFAGSYVDELKALGWPDTMCADACERFINKIEKATGLKRRSPVHNSHAMSP